MPQISLFHLNSRTSTSYSADLFHSMHTSGSTDASHSVRSFSSAESANTVCHIFLIRHGATPGNLEGRYIGRTDESLSETGRDEILQHEYPSVDIVFSSPMRRCRETASLIYPEKARFTSIDEDWSCSEQIGRTESEAERTPLKSTVQAEPDMTRVLRVIEEFHETDFGAFEGKNHRELDGNEDYQAWIDSMGELPFPDGESRAEVKSRVICGLRKMMTEIATEITSVTSPSARNGDDRHGCLDFHCGEITKYGEENSCTSSQDDSYTRTENRNSLDVALIAHGGTMMTLLQELFGGNYFDYMMKNGEGYSFEISHDGICSGLRARSYHRGPGELAASGALDRKSDRKTHEPLPE